MSAGVGVGIVFCLFGLFLIVYLLLHREDLSQSNPQPSQDVIKEDEPKLITFELKAQPLVRSVKTSARLSPSSQIPNKFSSPIIKQRSRVDDKVRTKMQPQPIDYVVDSSLLDNASGNQQIDCSKHSHDTSSTDYSSSHHDTGTMSDFGSSDDFGSYG